MENKASTITRMEFNVFIVIEYTANLTDSQKGEINSEAPFGMVYGEFDRDTVVHEDAGIGTATHFAIETGTSYPSLKWTAQFEQTEA